MKISTHKGIDSDLCGTPIALSEGYSKVRLEVSRPMTVDDTGLVHGGFVFGLADYAAMLAVNHPNVVLGGAEVKFLRPVREGELLIAEARVEGREGKKALVQVLVKRDAETVFQGVFTCFSLERHVLAQAE